jgi:hypothetical protein
MTSKKIAKIKLQRGVESERVERTFKDSELVYSIDEERMFIGDGQTKGGILVSNRNYVVNSLNGVLNLPKSIFYGDIVNDKATNNTYIIGYAADGVTLTPYIISDGNCLKNLNKRLKQLIDTIAPLTGCLNPPCEGPPPILPLVIVQQPVSVTTKTGSSASFQIKVTGSGTITYKWYKGNVEVPHSNNRYLILKSVQNTDIGLYKCEVSSSFGGSVTSNIAELKVINPAAIQLLMHCDNVGYGAISIPETPALVYTGDFEIAFWVKMNAESSYITRLYQSVDGDIHTSIHICEYLGKIYIAMSSNGSSWDIFDGVNTTTKWPTSWGFFQFIRIGNEYTAFLDGVSFFTLTSSAILHASKSSRHVIGGQSESSSRTFNGYIDDFRITIGATRTKGVVPTGPFPTDIAGDPLFDKVSLLLNWENGFEDSSKNNLIINYNQFTTELVNTSKWGTKCVHFNGANALLRNDDSTNNAVATIKGRQPAIPTPILSPVGTGCIEFGGENYISFPTISKYELLEDFTIEFFFRQTSKTPNGIFNLFSLGKGANSCGTPAQCAWVVVCQDGYLGTNHALYFGNYGYSPAFTINNPFTINLNQWYHISVTRENNDIRLFIDGKMVATKKDTPSTGHPALYFTRTDLTNPLQIGYGFSGCTENFFRGYMSEIIIVTGKSLYTSDFTPRTTKLTSI